MSNTNPYQPIPYVKIQHPEWSRNAVIYQINTRQFTEEGTFRAAEKHLPRLKELGVDILWLMPIHEIGMKNRKGTLGSPYSVKDYYGVNPEFGTLEDLRHFVKAAHETGMYVILDWVANHDKNAWEGTEYEKFGDGLEATIVLSVISEGMPLIYNGQEAGNAKRLEFFEKDLIEWREHKYGELYKKLIALKKKNTALWNGKWGATMIRVLNNVPMKVFSFVRQNEKDKVFAVFNFSAQPQSVKFNQSLYHGKYTDFFSRDTVELSDSTQLELKLWAYRVFVK